MDQRTTNRAPALEDEPDRRTEHDRLWDVLWLRAKDLTAAAERLHEYASGYARFAESAYGDNRECEPASDETEAADVAMLERQLVHLESWLNYLTDDVKNVRAAVQAL